MGRDAAITHVYEVGDQGVTGVDAVTLVSPRSLHV
jgi:hypothetical protein